MNSQSFSGERTAVYLILDRVHRSSWFPQQRTYVHLIHATGLLELHRRNLHSPTAVGVGMTMVTFKSSRLPLF